MRYFKTVINGKLKRIDACDIAVSGEEISKEEYEKLKSDIERSIQAKKAGEENG